MKDTHNPTLVVPKDEHRTLYLSQVFGSYLQKNNIYHLLERVPSEIVLFKEEVSPSLSNLNVKLEASKHVNHCQRITIVSIAIFQGNISSLSPEHRSVVKLSDGKPSPEDRGIYSTTQQLLWESPSSSVYSAPLQVLSAPVMLQTQCHHRYGSQWLTESELNCCFCHNWTKQHNILIRSGKGQPPPQSNGAENMLSLRKVCYSCFWLHWRMLLSPEMWDMASHCPGR